MAEITFHNQSNLLVTYNGKTYEGDLISEEEVKWSDGDIWVRAGKHI